MLFRCTQKVRITLGLSDRELARVEEVGPPDVMEWYVNLLTYQRRKCLLFTNATTLFSFFVPGVQKSDLHDFGGLFRFHLTLNLGAGGFSPQQISRLLDGGPDRFAKARDRAVLGSMVDYAKMTGFQVEDHGFEAVDFVHLNQSLNDTPMSVIGMRHATAVLKELVCATASA